ncbi:MAG TPA: class I SAM-dependent methyltransferase [Thermoplasmata archaeon]|jgi:SAM-dependent methyltransferase
MDSSEPLVKADFDIGWRRWRHVPEIAELLLQHQKGDVLDVGCATCQNYGFLRGRGWKGKYYGIDIAKYEEKYPEGISLTIGDANKLEFPEVDTVILYDILEHVDDPASLLKKALNAARKNVLIALPMRNEEMWRLGIAETHQVDKTHKHAGFSREEVEKLVSMSGGRIASCRNLGRATAIIGVNFWEGWFPKKLFYLMGKLFKSKAYYWGIWCEVVRQ